MIFGKKLSPEEQENVDGLYLVLDEARATVSREVETLIESNLEMLMVCQKSNKGTASPGDWATAVTPASIGR